MNKWLFFSLHCFSCFLLVFKVAAWRGPKQRAAGGETLTTGCQFIIELTRINTHRNAHTAPHCSLFPVYISLDCGEKLRLNPDKYSSCKLRGPRFKTIRQQSKPPNHCTTLINKWHTNTDTPLSSPCLCLLGIFRVVNSLWLCLRPKSPPVCVCVCCGYQGSLWWCHKYQTGVN